MVIHVEVEGVEVRLRDKNQITLPEAVVSAIGARSGDHFRVTAGEGGTVTLRLLRESYAGALTGLWGTTDADVVELLDREREARAP